jgi:hypothetical protein
MTYERLMEIYFAGLVRGNVSCPAQYRSAVWAQNAAQAAIAKRVAERAGKSAVPVLEACAWTDAEPHHQHYFGRGLQAELAARQRRVKIVTADDLARPAAPAEAPLQPPPLVSAPPPPPGPPPPPPPPPASQPHARAASDELELRELFSDVRCGVAPGKPLHAADDRPR